MSRWVIEGIRTGIKTTDYPGHPETAPGVTPGLPLGGEYSPDSAAEIVARCPTGALSERDGEVFADYRRCVHSFRCARQIVTPLAWADGYEWAGSTDAGDPTRQFGSAFGRSINIIVVDAGDCGACLNEVKQLSNPYYNMHRLGFFITPTPRHADVLLVVGPGTDQMRVPLLKTYEAMPTPKRVMAVGACALSGGVFGPSFVSEGGIGHIIPVDVEVPGEPPPPLAILHGLLVVTERKPAASLTSPSETSPAEASAQ